MEKINSDFSQINLKIKIDKKLRTYKSLLLGFTAISIFCFGSGILQNHDISFIYGAINSIILLLLFLAWVMFSSMSVREKERDIELLYGFSHIGAVIFLLNFAYFLPEGYELTLIPVAIATFLGFADTWWD